MPTYTGDMIRKCRTEKGLTQKKLGELCGIADSNIRKYESGNQNPKIETLQKIADYFNVTIDFLMTGKESSEKKSELTARDERDIEKILNQTREQLLSQEGLMFDGKPASPEAVESILSAMKIGMEMAKEKNKEKYTPKKYKKD